MSDQLRVCPECGDLLPMPCSDPRACIMTDDLADRHTNGRYKQISEHVDGLNKRINAGEVLLDYYGAPPRAEVTDNE